jgi:hypothetical protein
VVFVLSNLQLLRAFAAISVVILHSLQIASLYGQGATFFSVLEGWGNSGVDIFFVISGFVMYYAQMSSHKSAYCFIKHRIIRIVPIYWLLTISIVALFFLLPSVFNHTPPSVFNVLSSLLFVSHGLGENHPVLYVGWTLEYEMLFYAVFAFSLLFKRDSITLWLPVALLTFVTMLGFVSSIVLEFVFGVLAAKLFFDDRWHRYGGITLALGLLLLLLSIAYPVYALANRVLWWGIPAVLIVFGAVTVRQQKSRLLSYLGDASYSIYLLQVFTIPAFYKFASKFLAFVHGDILFIVSLLFSITLGCLFYSIVEKPVTIYLNRTFGCSR